MTVFEVHNVQCIFNVYLEGRTCTRYKIHFDVLPKIRWNQRLTILPKKLHELDLKVLLKNYN